MKNYGIAYYNEKLMKWVRDYIDYKNNRYEITIYDRSLYLKCKNEDKTLLNYIAKSGFEIVELNDISPYKEYVKLTKCLDLMSSQELKNIKSNCFV